jgi:hypothetical protein
MQAEQDLTVQVNEPLVTDSADLTGRAAVRFYLLAPLAGLPRKRGCPLAVFEADLATLSQKLAYMAPRQLTALSEIVLRHAGASAHPVWPDPALVLAWAYRLRPPPPRTSDYVRSYMTCEVASRARAEGWLVELWRVIKRDRPPPPNAFQQQRLRDEAAENSRRRTLIADRIARGRNDPADQDWLAHWAADSAEIEMLLADWAKT